LAQLTEILNCEKEYLWCIPGNHDIDQSVLKENTAIPAVHDRLRKAADKDVQLKKDLEVENTGRLDIADFRQSHTPYPAYRNEPTPTVDRLLAKNVDNPPRLGLYRFHPSSFHAACLFSRQTRL
jgi:hypothetical protein